MFSAMFGPNSPSRIPGHKQNVQPKDTMTIENKTVVQKLAAREILKRQMESSKRTQEQDKGHQATAIAERPVQKATAVTTAPRRIQVKPESPDDDGDPFSKIIEEELRQAKKSAKQQEIRTPRRLVMPVEVRWALRLIHVFRIYGRGRNSVRALKDVSMEIPRGCMAGVVGPSGSGKSTLLHVIAGMDTPEILESSDILFSHKDDSGRLTTTEIAYWDQAFMNIYRRYHVGVIFQQPNLFSEMSAWENVAVPLLAQGFTLREARRKCKKMLEFVSMRKMSRKRPGKMSGGEQQRVAVARALVKEPPLIVADEPTGNLDKENTHIVMELLKKAQKEKGSTVILVTHDERLVSRYCDVAFRFTDTGVVVPDRQICSQTLRRTANE